MEFQSLQHPIRWLFLLHALAGLIALLSFSVPWLSKKGSPLHVRSGWIYICSMCFVGLSTFIISPWRIFLDQNRTANSQGFSVFLLFISVLTLSAIWYGMRALKFKDRRHPNKSILQIGPGILLALSAFGTQVTGYFLNNPLLMLFPILGYATALGQIRYWTNIPKEKKHWLYSHIEGMGVACISTVTAFLVTAIPRMTTASFLNSPILWITPGIIGSILVNKSVKKYRTKFGD